jgi:phenylpropionate dioxygenase-like ring-hydroxylating dioxygenase large terminal subunit
VTNVEKRSPFATYPRGWFQVAYSREVDTGDVVGLHYFGRRLICYRGDSGTPYVLDAYCPHLGADIAVGGTVAEDCIVCPFHGWRFDGSGSNIEIPYAKTVNRTARLRAWPTVERAGAIFVWYSADATEPEWELPKIPESDDAAFTFHAPESARWRFRSHPQEVFENTVDIAHFATVHGVSGFGDLDLEVDGHRLKAVAEVTFQTPARPCVRCGRLRAVRHGHRRGASPRSWTVMHPADGHADRRRIRRCALHVLRPDRRRNG